MAMNWKKFVVKPLLEVFGIVLGVKIFAGMFAGLYEPVLGVSVFGLTTISGWIIGAASLLVAQAALKKAKIE